jgi:hypothetical protein
VSKDSLRTPAVKVRELQEKLHRSAKADRINAECLRLRRLREPDAGKPHVRFDEGALETDYEMGLRHRSKAKAYGNRLPKSKAPRQRSTLPSSPSSPPPEFSRTATRNKFWLSRFNQVVILKATVRLVKNAMWCRSVCRPVASKARHPFLPECRTLPEQD